MNNKEKILQRIASRTRKEKPIRSLFIRSARLGAMAACIALLCASIFLVSLFIFDIFEKSAIEEFLNQSIYTPAHFFFEYLALAVLLIVIFVYMYRKFDWPLVKERTTIFVIGIVVSLVLGFGIAAAAEHLFFLRESLHTVKNAYVSHMPVRAAQRATTGALLAGSSNLIGTIAKITEADEEINISIVMKGVEHIYTMKESSMTERLRTGEKVALHVDTDGTTITKIKIIK